MRSAKQAVAAAKNQVSHPSQNWQGWCLKFVRTCWGIQPSGIYDADEGWSLSKKRHGDKNPPLGAPVYWAVGSHGHVAISAGGGKVYSTDIKRKGKVDLVTIGTITKNWGATYRGWTSDWCGRFDLPLPKPGDPGKVAKVSLAAVIKAAKQDPGRPQGGTTPGAADDVKHVEAALRDEGFLAAKYAKDGSFGSLTVEAYKKWQRKLGYSGKDADGIPGKTSLTKLGQRQGFDVVS